jgi:hypothetical protein
MKLRLLLFMLVVALFPGSLFSNTLYFPQVAFGGGYSTTFALVNTGTTGVSGRLNLYSQAGSLRSDLGGQLDIAPGNSVRVTIPNTGPLTAVWGEFNAGAGTVQGVATFDSRDPSGRLVTSAGVLGVEADNQFLIPVDITAPTASTGLAVANVSNTDLTLELRLYGENGALLETNLNFPLRAHAQIADFVPSIIAQIAGTPSFRGTLVIKTLVVTPSLAVTALTVKEGLLSALPVISAAAGGASVLEFPQVAFGGGYSTTLTIMNAGAGLAQADLHCFTQAGVERTDLARTLSAPGNGSTRSTIPNLGALTVVWCELRTITGSVQGVATFDLRSSSQALLTTAGVLGLQPSNSFSLPVDVSPAGGTGVAVANARDTNLGVTVRLLNESGALVATATDARFTNFAARGQAADFVTNIFPQLNGLTFRGALIVQAAAGAPAGSLAATALTIKEGVLSALPVIPGAIVVTGTGTISGGTGGGTGGTGGVTGGTGGTGGGTGGTGGGGGTLGGGPSSDCLNLSLYTNPITVHLEYLAGGSVTGTSTTDTTSSLNVAFEGQTATEFRSTVNSSFSSVTSVANTKSYGKVDGSDLLLLGTLADITSPVTGSIKVVFTPPSRDHRYALAVGETYSQTYSATTTSTFTGLPNSVVSTTNQTQTVKYLGRETITVFGGTFDTCKFEEGGGTSNIWMGAGNAAGVMIKTVSGGSTTLEFKVGTINGSAIRP